MSEETILVTGAAGGVGSTARVAIGILLEQGRRVRAMVRNLDARADALRDLGAEVVVADMLDIVALSRGSSAETSLRNAARLSHGAAAGQAISMRSMRLPIPENSGIGFLDHPLRQASRITSFTPSSVTSRPVSVMRSRT